MARTGKPFRRVLIVLGAAAATVILNCSSSNSSPCYGIVVGDKLDITIVDTYDTNSQFFLAWV
ncbi:MAG: hypothetical protein M3O50_13710 [Myxococcota bacterium]|nr:hypothetical protein [Myxococcota bacterium]